MKGSKSSYQEQFLLLCLRFKAEGGGGRGSELNRKLLEAINSSGRICMTRTIVDGMYMLRLLLAPH